MYECRAKAGMILVHAQGDVNLRILLMFESTVSLDTAHFITASFQGDVQRVIQRPWHPHFGYYERLY